MNVLQSSPPPSTFPFLSTFRWAPAARQCVSVQRRPLCALQGWAWCLTAAAAARCVPPSSTRTAVPRCLATITRGWSVTTATMWPWLWASAGVSVEEVVCWCQSGWVVPLCRVERGSLTTFEWFGWVCLFIVCKHGSTLPSLSCAGAEGETNHVLKVLTTSRLSTSHPSGTEIFWCVVDSLSGGGSSISKTPQNITSIRTQSQDSYLD